MKRSILMILIAALMIVAVPTIAQDETDEAPCAVDFADVISDLNDAQAAFGDGYDVMALGEAIAEAQDALQAIRDDCRRAAQGPGLPLDAEYTATDDFREQSFAFSYPADWTVDDQGLVVVVGTSQSAIDAFEGDDPVFGLDDFGFGIIADTENSLVDDEVNNVYELADGLTENIQIEAVVGPYENFSVNDRPAVRVDLTTETYTIVLVAVDYGDARYVVFIAGGQPETIVENEATFFNVVQSLRLDP